MFLDYSHATELYCYGILVSNSFDKLMTESSLVLLLCNISGPSYD